MSLWAEHPEVVNLSLVIAMNYSRVLLVPLIAAHAPKDRAFPQPAGLTLDPRHLGAVVYDEVVARVFAERDQHGKPQLAKSEHYGKGCPVTNVLGMLHLSKVPAASAGPCPNQPRPPSLTMRQVPE